MIFSRVNQWSGAALMLSSLLFILNKLDDMSWAFLSRRVSDLITGDDYVLVTLGQLMLVAGLIGCYVLYAPRSGRMGKLSLGILCGGGILLAVGHGAFMTALPGDPLFPFVIFGVIFMLVGLILFGIVNLRSRALWRWQALPLITGLLGFATFFLGDSITGPTTFLVLRTLFGVGLIWLGYTMWLDKREARVDGNRRFLTFR